MLNTLQKLFVNMVFKTNKTPEIESDIKKKLKWDK